MLTIRDISACGAVGDGETLNTASIQRAIDEVTAAGGGEVVVPAGTFRTGTIFLKDRVTLTLCQGARLLGSDNLDDYTSVSWGHHMDRTPWHLVVALDTHHVVIRGEGEIDGNGPSFWEKDRESEWHFWVADHHRPSPMVEISRCTDVRVEGVTLKNSAGWTLHLHDTDRALVHGIRIDSTLFGPNTDGIDITGCRDVIVSDCHITAGDDAIALKTTVDSRSCEYITVTNCVLETNCVAIRVGYESNGDFRHLTFSNCVVKNCSRGLELLTVEGGVIEHVAVSNIVGTTNCGWPYNRPIAVYAARIDPNWNLHPDHSRYGTPEPPAGPSAVRHVTFTNVDFVTDGRVMVGAADGTEVRDINFTNLRLRYAMIDDPQPAGPRLDGNAGFFRGMPALRGARAAFAAENVNDLVLRDFRVDWPAYPVPEDWNMLRSTQWVCNPDYYRDNLEWIRAGELKPPFHAFWGRNLTGGSVDIRDVRGSEEGVDTALVTGSTIRVSGTPD